MAAGASLEVEALRRARRACSCPPSRARCAARASARAPRGGATRGLRAVARAPAGTFAEEDRTRQPSLFSLLRAVIALFASPEDERLGLYGAFGYDLAFQFEPLPLRSARDARGARPRALPARRDPRRRPPLRARGAAPLRLRLRTASRPRALAREAAPAPFARAARARARGRPRRPASYAARRRARDRALPRRRPLRGRAEPDLLRALRRAALGALRAPPARGTRRPTASSPTSATASGWSARRPRCTCASRAGASRPARSPARSPAAPTRSRTPSRSSACSPPRRRSRSSPCAPTSTATTRAGSASRAACASSRAAQIELYSRLIHTVDHVEGTLRGLRRARRLPLPRLGGDGHRRAEARGDGLHRGARGVARGASTAAPLGVLGFDGSANTGLTLRTIRVAGRRGGGARRGDAPLRLGPRRGGARDAAQGRGAPRRAPPRRRAAGPRRATRAGAAARVRAAAAAGPRVLLVDCQDSFVHTLAGYFRGAGAKVKTLRAGFPLDELRRQEPDLVVLSPGPGRPADVRALAASSTPRSRAGSRCSASASGSRRSPSTSAASSRSCRRRATGSARACASSAGGSSRGCRGSSRPAATTRLVARPETLPPELRVTAVAEDGAVMAARARVAARSSRVQFHPESILTLGAASATRSSSAWSRSRRCARGRGEPELAGAA